MSNEQHDQIVFEDENERHGFTQIPNVVLTSTVLSPTAVRIYGILRRYASMPKGAMPSVPTVCIEANISKATYNREVKTFIRSTENPNPAIPLITAIHRRNKSNVFKIHKLTDQLIALLKPAITMEETDLERLKEKYKKKGKKKGGSQNETPIENTRESQIDTHQGTSQNETPGVSNCDTNNIEHKQDRQRRDVVVSHYQEEFKKLFNAELTDKDAKAFFLEAKKNGKDLLDYIHYVKNQSEKKTIGNPVGYLRDAVYGNWAVPSVAELEQAAAKEAEDSEVQRKQYDEKSMAVLAAYGIDPKEVGY
jgi:hypothetical protein